MLFQDDGAVGPSTSGIQGGEQPTPRQTDSTPRARAAGVNLSVSAGMQNRSCPDFCGLLCLSFLDRSTATRPQMLPCLPSAKPSSSGCLCLTHSPGTLAPSPGDHSPACPLTAPEGSALSSVKYFLIIRADASVPQLPQTYHLQRNDYAESQRLSERLLCHP